jgi:transcriptional regulator with XRE-family HTH domain
MNKQMTALEFREKQKILELSNPQMSNLLDVGRSTLNRYRNTDGQAPTPTVRLLELLTVSSLEVDDSLYGARAGIESDSPVYAQHARSRFNANLDRLGLVSKGKKAIKGEKQIAFVLGVSISAVTKYKSSEGNSNKIPKVVLMLLDNLNATSPIIIEALKGEY